MMKKEKVIIESGLRPLPPDERDLSFGGIFGADLPPDIDFAVGEPLEIKNQAQTDMCAAFSVASASEFQEGEALQPEYQFAKIKELEGDYKTWGADIRMACKSAQKFGSLPAYEYLFKDAVLPPRLSNDWRNYVANPANYLPEADEKALPYRKQSYFLIERGGLDIFDSLRSALWKNREDKAAIVTGCYWSENWNNSTGLVSALSPEGSSVAHAFILIGQKMIEGVPHLIAQLSNGLGFGDKGLFYFPREVVNREFVFGAFSFRDLPKEEAKLLNKWKLTIKWRWLAKVVLAIKAHIKFIFE